MNLRELVERYRSIAGGYGSAVPLAAFGLSREETERLFAVFDEDYHISRFFRLSDRRAETTARVYRINGFEHTHVTIDKEVEAIL